MMCRRKRVRAETGSQPKRRNRRKQSIGQHFAQNQTSKGTECERIGGTKIDSSTSSSLFDILFIWLFMSLLGPTQHPVRADRHVSLYPYFLSQLDTQKTQARDRRDFTPLDFEKKLSKR
mmetsp:Transcript_15609/g.31659  ORF Transcript_15609/g.31659 Transcript_15609/m.31659 type:complete len:119 (-) Transcript_15609:4588-4944(-)